MDSILEITDQYIKFSNATLKKKRKKIFQIYLVSHEIAELSLRGLKKKKKSNSTLKKFFRSKLFSCYF